MSKGKDIYLCGPIAGNNLDEATAWRAVAASAFEDRGYRAYSPLRGYEAEIDPGMIIGKDAPKNGILTQPSSIFKGDYHDVTRADAVLANFTGATEVSIGSMWEMAWAFDRGIPIVVAMGESYGAKDNPHSHLFVRQGATYVVTHLSEAISLTLRLLDN